jgi:hypothetical protein
MHLRAVRGLRTVFSTLVAEATDKPVWFLFIATGVLALVTGALAWAAWKALGQLRVGLQQLKVAVDQLEEIKRDRHVQVFTDMGTRWASQEMTEALQMEVDYTAESLARLFERASRDPSWNPMREYRRKRAEKATVVLLRVPNYFEEAATIARVGTLEGEVVDDCFGGVAKDEWKLWGLTLKSFQEKDKEAWVTFEQMAKRAD